MSSEVTFTVTITDEQIEHAIARATAEHRYDDDGDEYTAPLDLRSMVHARIKESINKEIAKCTPEIIRAMVEDRVRQALDDGFPVHSQWGERVGTKTLSEVVGEMVFKKNDRYDTFDLARFIREEAKKHAADTVAKAVKSAAADIDKVFRDAASEGLARMLKSKLGIS